MLVVVLVVVLGRLVLVAVWVVVVAGSEEALGLLGSQSHRSISWSNL